MKTMHFIDADGNSKYLQVLQEGSVTESFIPLRAGMLNLAPLGIIPNVEAFGVRGSGRGFDIADSQCLVWGGIDLGTKVTAMTYSSTADITKLTSSNAGDTEDILIIGLNSDWDKVEQTITLTGQTAATLSTPLIRVLSMENVGSTTLAGDVFLATSAATYSTGIPTVATTIRGVIPAGLNVSQSATFTVPAGYSALLYKDRTKLINATVAEGVVAIWKRKPGSVFQEVDAAGLNTVGSGSMGNDYQIPAVFEEKTDIEFRFTAETDDCAVSVRFCMLLVDTSKL